MEDIVIIIRLMRNIVSQENGLHKENKILEMAVRMNGFGRVYSDI